MSSIKINIPKLPSIGTSNTTQLNQQSTINIPAIPKLNLTPTSSPSPKNKSNNQMNNTKNNKEPCSMCKRLFLPKTLNKNGGICGKCHLKQNGLKKLDLETGNPNKISNKQKCSSCDKEFTEKTLKKNNGICGKCKNKEENKEENKDEKGKSNSKKNDTREKQKCSNCNNEFTERTLKKNGGVCGKCIKKSSTNIINQEIKMPNVEEMINIPHIPQINNLPQIPKLTSLIPKQ